MFFWKIYLLKKIHAWWSLSKIFIQRIHVLWSSRKIFFNDFLWFLIFMFYGLQKIYFFKVLFYGLLKNGLKKISTPDVPWAKFLFKESTSYGLREKYFFKESKSHGLRKKKFLQHSQLMVIGKIFFKKSTSYGWRKKVVFEKYPPCILWEKYFLKNSCLMVFFVKNIFFSKNLRLTSFGRSNFSKISAFYGHWEKYFFMVLGKKFFKKSSSYGQWNKIFFK